ncbi:MULTISPECIES: flagellar export chaperone FlgN [unclassified Leisingera]|uniref:flagellar export chaperone FlgN n=1 Tax=unclassified Leisingera TaxID=2614906 RepID=UPI0002EFC7C5|nr:MULTISPECIES: flagellar export chaperone FlgN [unclassified Leisingera]KIC24253.1 flagellar biosynthesis protein FlgN [Leisingera sp. ANG-S3]KIC52969.1 flagellar biosynthesis protein FlgN [Leisingera sp. ANG-S]KID07369.1 flagellar biosynthesis protein FlgN [Leisingera sp. ANG1]
MSKPEPQQLIDELDEILDKERTALMAGDLGKLESLLAKKEKIIGKLNSVSELEREALEQVQTKLSRNQNLLDSAMDGIRTVAARMAELRRIRKGLDVYDQSGRRTRYGTRNGAKLEKRA